ncbi:hypothetical protein MT216_000739, partial [Escherichia coli]|nr:hypothetical protein [Escherichia coli]
KMNTDERFDQTIKEKVHYFFNNDRGFSEEMIRISNSSATDAVSSELESMMLDDSIEQVKIEMRKKIESLSNQIQSLQEAVSLLSPESDPELDTNIDEITQAHINSGRKG